MIPRLGSEVIFVVLHKTMASIYLSLKATIRQPSPLQNVTWQSLFHDSQLLPCLTYFWDAGVLVSLQQH